MQFLFKLIESYFGIEQRLPDFLARKPHSDTYVSRRGALNISPRKFLLNLFFKKVLKFTCTANW